MTISSSTTTFSDVAVHIVFSAILLAVIVRIFTSRRYVPAEA
jgi:hypothetical protein